MITPTTASVDTIAANTFGAYDADPFPKAEPQVSSEKTGDLTGFYAEQDRVSITPQAQAKANAEQQITQTNANQSAQQSEDIQEPSNEFIQVSSSIGRASSSGNLRREEAMAIYQKIASLI